MAYRFSWTVVADNAPFILEGLQLTALISSVSLCLAMTGGLLIALMDMSRFRSLRWLALCFGELVRNTPILVQILWIYYVLPIVFDIQISALLGAILGLSLYSSAFIAEVYRAGIQAVPKGHREAAQVLGMSQAQTFLRIVLPQALRISLPLLASNFVQLIKYSSLGSLISVAEVTRRAIELSSATFRPLEIFTFLGVVYFGICWPLTMLIRWWERRLAAR